MLTNNRNFLRINHRPLLTELSNYTIDTDKVIVENSKKGLPTLKLQIDNHFNYIHSKYDPFSEARRIVEQYEVTEGTEHLLILGLGLGHHLEILHNKYPHLSFTIYEPNMDVLAIMLQTISLDEKFDQSKISFITRNNIEQKLKELQTIYRHKIQIFTIPFYDKHYSDELNQIYTMLVESLKNEKSRLVTNISYQKRWTINAMKNLPKVLKTPNILKDIDKEYFRGKAAIIVSAGPSLNFEFENLRYIKEKGLAYVFSVGSAINVLIENDIYPDAICTYDPQAHNYRVIEKVKSLQIDTIPMVFGSTVGYETLYNYQGPLMHMIINQDTLATAVLRDEEKLPIINDAPSIALVTYQLLTNLGISNIYLVGQNLSFQNRKRYATGINYHEDVTDETNLINIRDVNGNDVLTDNKYNQMRKLLEVYIKATPEVQVFNTTRNGAHIDGTEFIQLETAIDEHLHEENQVIDEWFKANQHYSMKNVYNNSVNLFNAKNDCKSLLWELDTIVSKITDTNLDKNENIEKKFAKFDKQFKILKKNKYYVTILSPMLRVQIESLANKSKRIKYINNIDEKIDQFKTSFGLFLSEIQLLMEEIEPYFTELQEKLYENRGI
ncbi:motility associated factor glycosyltransferase family protein [Paraliobacillus ryukyuensis]|uniref:motility associated factor glycosyltransferase family protein n=1 Tax=Paraliobacillus ryukyuensis TaxID=200904 RepID=UPI0015C4D6E0|nr:6-hydroxymethylpterin diphosphokinase MptE-like protein [Paraliobacillus ryukyuensis]